MSFKKLSLKEKRTRRVRRRLKSQSDRPRLSVFRSNRGIFAQIIDDAKGKTIVAASERELSNLSLKKVQRAFAVGKILATKAKKKKTVHVVFDRGSYKYHGRVKALADGAREGGLAF